VTIQGFNREFPTFINHQILVIGNDSQVCFVNVIASMNYFTISKVTFWCWGTFWSLPVIGWGTFWSPHDLGSGSSCATSELRHMLMVDIWLLSNGGTMAPTECHRFGSGVWAMTVSAWLHCFGSRTLVVRIVILWHTRSRCRISCRLFKSSSSIFYDMVESQGSTIWLSMVFWSVLSSTCCIRIIPWTLTISNTIL